MYILLMKKMSPGNVNWHPQGPTACQLEVEFWFESTEVLS